MRKHLLSCLVALLAVVLMLPAAFAEDAYINGTVLVGQFPLEAVIIDDQKSDDGFYSQTLLIDSLVGITTMRLVSQDATVLDRIAALYPEQYDAKVVPYEHATLSYPVERATFFYGKNEDMKQLDAVLIKTDSFDFMFVSAVPVDFYEDYAEQVEWWIESLDLFDAEEPIMNDDVEHNINESNIANVVLVGQFPLDAVSIEDINNDDGTYRETLLVDSLVGVTTMRLLGSQEDGVIERIAAFYPEQYDSEVVPYEHATFSYPVERATFYNGENEDKKRLDAVLIKTDSYDFMFVSEVPVDFYEDYAEQIEWWIESLDLFDAGLSTPQSVEPFNMNDIYAAVNTEFTTVKDFINTAKPSYYMWDYKGAATGETVLSLVYDTGAINLTLIDVEKYLDPELGMLETKKLPTKVLSERAYIRELFWDDVSFHMPTIRGITIGDSKESVLSKFPNNNQGDILYDETLINPEADKSWFISEEYFVGGRILTLGPADSDGWEEAIEYVYTNLISPDEWREYYTATFYMKDDVVSSMSLTYESDPE